MKSNMDELYAETMERVMETIHDHDCICVQCDSSGVKREQFAQRHDPSCAYELPEKWDREPEPFPLPPDECTKCEDDGVIRDGTFSMACVCGKYYRAAKARMAESQSGAIKLTVEVPSQSERVAELCAAMRDPETQKRVMQNLRDKGIINDAGEVLVKMPMADDMHETQQMYVLRDGDRVIGYFPRREDAEQRLLCGESVDEGKAWVTVR